MKSLYPLRFHPVYKDYPWGGNRIPALFGRDLPPDGIYAESWEISTHPDGETTIANGPLAGKTLSELLADHSSSVLGSTVNSRSFPLLIKLIDAKQILSVQVHPDEQGARRVGGDPKTEMWYFLDGDGTAKVYCGLQPEIGKAGFLQALENKSFKSVLQAIPARRGDAVFVPGGQVHAIGEGCLLLEIQQNSNTTYRVYDWDRTGPDGKPRDLHLDKALEVIDWEHPVTPLCRPVEFLENGLRGTCMKESSFFRLDRFELTSESRFPVAGDLPTAPSFHALFIAKGDGTIGWPGGQEPLRAGQSWLIPAALNEYTVCPGEKTPLTLLRTTLPVR